MDKNKFEPGEVVTLKSGGPLMTVEEHRPPDQSNPEGRVRCLWFTAFGGADATRTCGDTFPPKMLRRHTSGG